MNPTTTLSFLPERAIQPPNNNSVTLIPKAIENKRVDGFERTIKRWAIRLRIFYFTCILFKSPKKIWSVYKSVQKFRSNVWGGDLKKLYKVDNKFYFNQYTPGWPSKAFDSYIKSELRRRADPISNSEKLSFIFLAITRKCPMRCEHCYEWDNLNQNEIFTRDDLFKVVDLYQQAGVLQFHFSGGEPMVRVKDLIELIRYASPKSECWVLTSGFNVTEGNAKKLKEAGCKGMVVSVDHYLPEIHNMFRGNETAFKQAVFAAETARRAGLVTTISVCATKHFLDGGHLLPYMDFAKKLGVQFVQVLEPKSVGRYEGKNVMLEKKHIEILEETFKMVNHSPLYKDYPTMLYHGYHQRRVGCFSESRSVYVDSAGDVHACPFCHTKMYNIIDVVRNEKGLLPSKDNRCPQFEQIP